MSARPAWPLRGALLVALSVAVAAPRAAQADRARKAMQVAQKYIELGEDLFRLDKFREAADNFVGAVDTLKEAGRPVPAPLYRALARCHDELADVDAAISYYEEFLARARARKRPSGKLTKAMAEARAAVLRLKAQRLARTTASVDDADPPPDAPDAAGAEDEESSEAAPGESADEGDEVDEAEDAEDAVPDEPAPSGGGALAWGLTGGAVGLASAAIALSFMAAGQEADADKRATNASEQSKSRIEDEVAEAYDSAGVKRNLALTLGAGALVAGGLATWLWLGSETDAGWAVGVHPSPNGAVLTVTR